MISNLFLQFVLNIKLLTSLLVILPIFSVLYTLVSIRFEKKIVNGFLFGISLVELIICTILLLVGKGAVFSYFNFHFTSLLFIWLTIFVIQLCTVFLPGERLETDVPYLLILLVKVPLILFFATTHLLIFYICFESVLFPLFYLIVTYGSRPEQRVAAAYKLFFYTILFFPYVFCFYIYLYKNRIFLWTYCFLPFNFITDAFFGSLFLPLAVKTPFFHFTHGYQKHTSKPLQSALLY